MGKLIKKEGRNKGWNQMEKKDVMKEGQEQRRREKEGKKQEEKVREVVSVG